MPTVPRTLPSSSTICWPASSAGASRGAGAGACANAASAPAGRRHTRTMETLRMRAKANGSRWRAVPRRVNRASPAEQGDPFVRDREQHAFLAVDRDRRVHRAVLVAHVAAGAVLAEFVAVAALHDQHLFGALVAVPRIA